MGRLPVPPVITCLIRPEDLDGEEVRITGDSYRHLFRARRLAGGARLRLTDGGGRARWGEVAAIGSRSAQILLGEAAPRHEAGRIVKLLVAVPRLQRASWLVEKATELGAAEIRFLRTERTSHPLSEGKLKRLRRVAAAALEQCHGSTLPRVTGPHELSEAPALLEGCGSRRYLDLPGAGIATGDGPRASATALLVGPEGGWSEAERTALEGWLCGAWSLGERVLRIETAAVVALGLLLHAAASGDAGSAAASV